MPVFCHLYLLFRNCVTFNHATKLIISQIYYALFLTGGTLKLIRQIVTKALLNYAMSTWFLLAIES